MECGKLRTDGSPIFYFIIDPTTPNEPDSVRIRNYYVCTHVDSYIEAFSYLARRLCTSAPDVQAALQRWHKLYNQVFGSVSFDNFKRTVDTIPVQHFHLESSETAARARSGVTQHSSTIGAITASLDLPASSQRQAVHDTRTVGLSRLSPVRRVDTTAQRGSVGTAKSLLSYPTVVDESARVELHRLRADLAETTGALEVERGKQRVHVLSEAERHTLMYKLEQSRREADTDRTKANDTNESLRRNIRALEDRLSNLVDTHEDAMKKQSDESHEKLTELEQHFARREQQLRTDCDESVRDRDRKLAKAVTRVQVFEQHLEDALKRIEEQKQQLLQLTEARSSSDKTRIGIEEENKALRRQLRSLEMQVEESQRVCRESQLQQRQSASELAELRTAVLRHQRESERFNAFSHSLHRELQQLDDSALTAADMLRRKVQDVRDHGRR